MDVHNFMIYYNDDVRLNEQVSRICQDLGLEVEPDTYSVKEDGIDQILALLNTPSFLSPTKVVVIKDASNIFNINDTYYNYLLHYLGNPADFSYLFLAFKNNKDPKFEQIKNICTYYDITKIKETPLEFINKYVNSHEYSITEVASSIICEYSDDLLLIKTILDELICYKIDTKEINERDILDILSPPVEKNVYEICNAVIKKDSLKAYHIYEDLIKANVSITYLLGLIINKFQELYNNNILISYNYSQNDLAEINHVSLGRAYYMLKEAKNISTSSVKRTLEKLYKMELNIKKGEVNPEVAFSTYLLSL